MRNKLCSVILLVIMLASAACAPQATPAPTLPAPTQAPTAAVEAPTAVPTSIPTVAPTAAPTAAPTNLTVLAASSLTESFTDIGKAFEAANPGVKVAFSFAGSQQLAQQLSQAAPADVFASASTKYMDAAVTANRVNKADVKTFSTNKLTVIYPTTNTAGIKTLQDLAKSGIKLVFADKTVPAGQYSLTFLDNAVIDKSFTTTYKDQVLKNVVSYEDNVKSVVTKVSLGEADAGIVYSTDVTTDVKDKVSKLEIPDALNVLATYPIAAISDSQNAAMAKAFIDMVMSADGQKILAGYGFLPPTQTSVSSTTGGSFSVTDALGRTVKFDKAPQKIAVVGKALFMAADAIYMFPEAGARISAIGSTKQGTYDFIPVYDPDYSKKTVLAGNAGAEQIAALQPDLVIMKSSNSEKLGKPLDTLKIPVVYVDFETPDQYARDLKILGQIFQNDARAQQLATFFQSSVDAIAKKVASSPKPKTLVLYYNSTGGTVAFNVAPMSWMQTMQVQMAGGEPVWKDANPGSGWTKVTLEQIATWDPEDIFIVSYFTPVSDVVKQLKADPKWQALSAVKSDKIYGFATDFYSWDEPDPRWILGVTWMATKLHPDLAAELDIKKAAQDFYQQVYGMDAATFEKVVVPTFQGDLP